MLHELSRVRVAQGLSLSPA